MRVIKLKVVSTGTENEALSFEFDKTVITLGRDTGNDLMLPSSSVSGSHAEIRAVKDGYYLVDLGSKNGVILNKKKIIPHIKNKIRPYARIGIAHYDIEFSVLDYSKDCLVDGRVQKPFETIVEELKIDNKNKNFAQDTCSNVNKRFSEQPAGSATTANENNEHIPAQEATISEPLIDNDSPGITNKPLSSSSIYYLVSFLAVVLGILMLIIFLL